MRKLEKTENYGQSFIMLHYLNFFIRFFGGLPTKSYHTTAASPAKTPPPLASNAPGLTGPTPTPGISPMRCSNIATSPILPEGLWGKEAVAAWRRSG